VSTNFKMVLNARMAVNINVEETKKQFQEKK
jgi:hypothetical protein